jgi:predicted HicB family RNase H-like nuclease
MVGKEWSEAMKNVMEISGVKAIIAFDPEIKRKTSGRLNLRLSQELYDKAATLAKASGKSVNAWIADVIRHTDDVLTH